MEMVLSDSDPRMLTTHRDLADVLAAHGRTRQAQQIYHQVLRLQRQHLGETHPDTLDTGRLMALHT
jgi:hypothetical protein